MQTSDKCGAKTRSGKPCRNDPVLGATRCRMHGGSSPQAKAAAQRRLVEADARAVLAHEGVEPIGDPIVELGKLAAEVSAMKDALAARVNALQSPTYADAFGGEHVRAEVRLYNESLDRCIKVLDLLGRHDLNDRLVRVQEDTGRLFKLIIDGVLAELDLTDEQAAQVPALIVKWLHVASEGVKARELPAA